MSVEVEDRRVIVDDAVRVEGDWVVLDFSLIGPPGHPSHYNPHLFQPGHTPPPKRVGLLSRAYRNKLHEVLDNGQTFAEAIADSMVATALSEGRLQVQAASEIADRTEGKPRQSVSLNVNVSLADRIRKARSKRMKKVIDVTPLSLQA
jgi:hypothetical protein